MEYTVSIKYNENTQVKYKTLAVVLKYCANILCSVTDYTTTLMIIITIQNNTPCVVISCFFDPDYFYMTVPTPTNRTSLRTMVMCFYPVALGGLTAGFVFYPLVYCVHLEPQV